MVSLLLAMVLKELIDAVTVTPVVDRAYPLCDVPDPFGT
jgi:hypothetical protein